MKLAIISHTKHFLDKDGTLVGWGPTISELNHLAPHFEKIYHIAALHDETPPPSSLPYEHNNIEFVALPPTGGASVFKKLGIVKNIPRTISMVRKVFKKVDAFQLRTPTGIGVYLIPYLTKFSNKRGWYKYAGNWNQNNAPLGYRLQKKMLIKQPRKVTINGSWPDQPQHCYTFENPCLTLEERKEGVTVISNKNYTAPFAFCFVGRLDDAKGVQRIIDAFSGIDIQAVAHIHFIGDGVKLASYKLQCEQHNIPATFHGFLSRNKVFDIYRESQFLLLPSTASEGFPKVIAEGMNFGCVPIVSNVSSIGQYINPKNGFVLEETSTEVLQKLLEEAMLQTHEELKKKAKEGYVTAAKFTFAHYNQRILKDILEINTK
ncbi:glycosyltransferase [Marinirhabdus gelatinilytica]|uniref:Glycosyl transferase family 1 n=1 Tax=Marinirhabdus gelatinilytica TaxID=1703343 RepID=A0A370Q8Z2_9FLAO|nr:glycosyltransferase [Marinirhabdus gelatinilytica]RDK84828.1 glycosyl transferase family 1 [Marinirhabdus gelatinilytica]